MIINSALSIFITLELANITILYFFPNLNKGNSIAVFRAWEESKKHENLHLFIQYLVYWIAGTKLIFIVLLLIILFFGTPLLKVYTIAGLILSIGSFYWKMFPIIKRLDKNQQLIPCGYSKTLALTIACFLGMFLGALLTAINL
ncbi:MAG: hypothetical protein ACRCWI_08700 [Brevinema sp.]